MSSYLARYGICIYLLLFSSYSLLCLMFNISVFCWITMLNVYFIDLTLSNFPKQTLAISCVCVLSSLVFRKLSKLCPAGGALCERLGGWVFFLGVCYAASLRHTLRMTGTWLSKHMTLHHAVPVWTWHCAALGLCCFVWFRDNSVNEKWGIWFPTRWKSLSQSLTDPEVDVDRDCSSRHTWLSDVVL